MTRRRDRRDAFLDACFIVACGSAVWWVVLMWLFE